MGEKSPPPKAAGGMVALTGPNAHRIDNPSLSQDFSQFYLAVINFLGKKPDARGLVSDLGLNAEISAKFKELSLPKNKKIGNILALRPDLFENVHSDKGAAPVKPQEAAADVLYTQQLPE